MACSLPLSLAPGLLLPTSRWTPMQEMPVAPLLRHLLLYLLLAICYAWSIRLVLATSLRTRAALPIAVTAIVWLASSVILWNLTPGGESHDIFDYIFRGRMMVEYGLSPLQSTPGQLAAAPYLAHITWREYVDTYGPLWEYASGLVAATTRGVLQLTGQWPVGSPDCPAAPVACEVLAAYVIHYRVMATMLALMSGGILFAIVHRETPVLAPATLLVWLWNPLLLLATAGAHNDMLMLVFWLLAFWCLQRRFWLAGLLMLALAAHVKITALLFAPIFLLWIVRNVGWRRALTTGLLALIIMLPISWALYAPLGGWATLPRMLAERSFYVANSPYQVLNYWLAQWGWPQELRRQLFTAWPTILFLALCALLSPLLLGFRRGDMGRAQQTPDSPQLWRAASVITLLYLTVGAFWFQYWYVLWWLLPSALLPLSRLTRWLAPWLAFGAMSSQALFDYLPLLYGQPLDRGERIVAVVAMIWTPAVLAVVVQSRLEKRKPLYIP
ncbi:MAG: hypothetical protein IPK16_13440 [Anaerolineales bacterium]|nr:hypothetical protein [Anaerolineales bacterium]